MSEIRKIVEPMFAEMQRLVTMENVTIGELPHIPQQNKMAKAERKLQLSFDAVLNREIHQMVSNPSLGMLHLKAGVHTYVIENNEAYFEGYNFMTEEEQTFTLSISAIRDVNESEGYMRMVIPISKSYWGHNLRTYSVKVGQTYFGGLMILKLDEGEVHVYTVSEGQSKQQYMIVEPQYKVSRATLFNIHYAVATGLGIITGTAYFGEAFLVTSDSLEFDAIRAISYCSLRETVHSQYVTFSTNMYWVEMLLKQGKYNGYALEMVTKKDGEVKKGLVDWLYEDVYGQIILNMYRYPEFARAAIILIDGTDKALDYQVAMYAVALETLCTKLKKIYGMKFDGIINNDNGTWTRVRKSITKTFLVSCAQYGVEEPQKEKIANKIPKLNEISNTDKFNLVIDRLELNRMQSDNDAIEQRNNLLHGELVAKTAEDSTDFDDMYYYSLVLHRLCAAIIFKFAGYKGYLVNNAVLMDRKIACDRREPVLVEV